MTTPVFIIKGKLVHLDNVLPLAYQMFTAGFFKNAHFVLPSKNDLKVLSENAGLMAAATKMGTVSALASSSRSRTWLSRLAGKVASLWILRHYFLGRVISFEIESSPWLQLLTDFNRRAYGGRRVFLILHNLPFEFGQSLYRSVSHAYGRQFKRNIPKCFAVVASHSQKHEGQLQPLDVPDGTTWVEVQYPRGIASWIDHLRSVDGRIDQPYIFMPLSIFYRKESNGREWHFFKSFEVIVNVVKEFEKECRIVFRFHPTTDRSLFNEIVTRSGLTNYEVSFSNPISLIAGASCLITYGGSTLTSDAWLCGCPTIEFAVPGASLYDDLKTSAFAGVTDHFVFNDKVALRAALRTAIDNGRIDRTGDPNYFAALAGEELNKRLAFLFQS